MYFIKILIASNSRVKFNYYLKMNWMEVISVKELIMQLIPSDFSIISLDF